jgi:hypothetical protein
MEVSGQFDAPADLPLERAPATHWIGGWVCPIAVLDAMDFIYIYFIVFLIFLVLSFIFIYMSLNYKSRDSSVGIALGYGLDDRG